MNWAIHTYYEPFIEPDGCKAWPVSTISPSMYRSRPSLCIPIVETQFAQPSSHVRSLWQLVWFSPSSDHYTDLGQKTKLMLRNHPPNLNNGCDGGTDPGSRSMHICYLVRIHRRDENILVPRVVIVYPTMPHPP
ncbi:hypothetical protein CY34DRAFT_566343 [Suillus luteus UH-Slu-Lm8-n1]|uniref:Uncharacterized protein n=1 Tax=Suillus luteus UH-Slu-Lm8-n1 TaxID=930992 RepID=A0A0D0AMZ9_9AGAM|nr:hypothetical protein CY34DRAFT_566343 [Suillus luteus UH-Slu-Lm8-n1]